MDALRILVVDDEGSQRELVGGFLKKQGHEVLLAGSGAEALTRVRETRVDLVLSDFKMPGMSGIELLRGVKGVNPEIPFILVTAYGTVETAVQAMREGAADYLTKPLDLEELQLRIGHVTEQVRLRSAVRDLQARLVERHRLEGIIGESGRMQEVLALVKQVAPSDATVLVRGESGTGKELIARAIHFNSRRAAGPLVTLNCAALPEQLLESELFGHEKGAFTDAKTTKKGLFELSDGGTIFLDEVGDMPLSLQAKLLRFLEERTFRRVGGTTEISVDVRLIAATNKDIEKAIAEGRFREDLMYRLNVIPIHLPPVRQRGDDVRLLSQHFATKLAREFKKPIHGIDEKAYDVLCGYDWPGNVRELRNVMERAVLLSEGETIGPKDIMLGRVGGAAPAEQPGRFTLPEGGLDLRELENHLIKQAMVRSNNNKAKAAKLLKLSRDAFRYRLERNEME